MPGGYSSGLVPLPNLDDDDDDDDEEEGDNVTGGYMLEGEDADAAQMRIANEREKTRMAALEELIRSSIGTKTAVWAAQGDGGGGGGNGQQ